MKKCLQPGVKTHIHKSTKNIFHFFSKIKGFTFRFSKNQATVVAGDRAGPDAELGRTGLRNGAVTCRQDMFAADVPNSFHARDIAYLALLNPFWESELVSWHLCSFGGDLLATTCALTSMHHATVQNLVSHLDINIIKTGLCMSASNSPVTCPTTCCWTSAISKVSFQVSLSATLPADYCHRSLHCLVRTLSNRLAAWLAADLEWPTSKRMTCYFPCIW